MSLYLLKEEVHSVLVLVVKHGDNCSLVKVETINIALDYRRRSRGEAERDRVLSPGWLFLGASLEFMIRGRIGLSDKDDLRLPAFAFAGLVRSTSRESARKRVLLWLRPFSDMAFMSLVFKSMPGNWRV